MGRRLLWLAPILLGGLVLAACENQEIGDTERIFAAPVWDEAETFEYELYDRELRGYCTHHTEVVDDLATLTTECTDSEGVGHRDDTTAVVDNATLEPITSERVVINVNTETRTEYGGFYDAPELVVVDTEIIDLTGEDETEIYDAERELPQPTDSAPEPGWYDETSLFWLMRGIPLEEGFEGRFANINIGLARIVGVDVEVEGIEEVEVPAGTFMAYNIRIESSITNRFWVDVEAPHRVVQARLEDTTYELVSWE